MFDFVADRDLRASLESDYAEMHVCLDAQAWKSVHILAGSLVEALLADYLIFSGKLKSKTRDEILAMGLFDLTKNAKRHGLISAKTSELSGAIRLYRNLIHPGAGVRLSETVSATTAQVAAAVSDMIIGDISAARTSQYGETPEQIVSKLQKDASAVHILKHLLRDMAVFERERLVVDVLPAAYMELHQQAAFDDEDRYDSDRVLSAYSKAYAIANATLDDDAQSRALDRLAATIAREDESTVDATVRAFVRGTTLGKAGARTRGLIVDRLLAMLESSLDSDLILAVEGLPPVLDQGRSRQVFVALLRGVAIPRYKHLAAEALDGAELFYLDSSESLQASYRSLTDSWLKFYEEKDLKEPQKRLTTLKSRFEYDDIPF
jgi:hypothetical protein